MDIATFIGIISAFFLIIISITMAGGLDAFMNIPSVLVVLGGTLCATLINYPLKDVINSIKIVKNAFFTKSLTVGEIIESFVDFSIKARREGLLSLEPELSDIEDDFLRKGLQFTIDGLEPQSIIDILETEINIIENRHRLGSEMFQTMGAFAPAFGMIGTLIGLVLMLKNMNDPSAIGPAMAVALITTFYGSILANVVFLPISGKLKTRSQQETLVKEMILQGVISLSRGDNPRIIEQKLHSYLPPQLRVSYFRQAGSSEMRHKRDTWTPDVTKNKVVLLLYTSTMVLLLTFFIMLTSNSVLDEKGMRKALDSLAATFDARQGGSAPWQEDGAQSSPEINLTSVIDKDLAKLRDIFHAQIDDDKAHILIGRDYRILSLETALVYPPDTFEIQEDMKPFLRLLAEVLRNSEYSIDIEGHTDDTPPHIEGIRDNWDLSARRAIGLLRFFLKEGGIASDRISAFGYAGNRPLAANNTPENRLRNNRIDIVLTDNAKSMELARQQTEKKDRQFGFKGFRFKLFD